MGWGMGGVKSFRSEGSKQWGGIFSVTTNTGRMVIQLPAKLGAGGSVPGQSTVASDGGAIFARSGLEPPITNTLTSRITIRPLLAINQMYSPLLGAAAATDKKPKLCVSV